MKLHQLKRLIKEEISKRNKIHSRTKHLTEQRPMKGVDSFGNPVSPVGSGPNSGRPNVSPVGGGGEPMNPTVLAQMMDRGMGPGTEVEPRIIFLFRWACQLMGYDGYQPSSAGGSEVGYNGRCI